MHRTALRPRPLHAALSLLALATVTAGCGRPFKPATPAEFVELEDQEPRYDYRATTYDGVVLGVRAIDNEPRADLGFWVGAVKDRMRSLGGYALLDHRAVKCRGGLHGTQLRFGHDVGAKPHLYYVTLFVDDSYLYLLEAGGLKDKVEKLAQRIDWSVENFEP